MVFASITTREHDAFDYFQHDCTRYGIGYYEKRFLPSQPITGIIQIRLRHLPVISGKDRNTDHSAETT